MHRDGAIVVGVDVPQAAVGPARVMGELDGERGQRSTSPPWTPRSGSRGAVEDEHGGVDIVVHNAGITRDKKLVEHGRATAGPR